MNLNVGKRNTISTMLLSMPILVFSAAASAEDGKGVLTIGLENDLFGAGGDAHYTHGTEITYVSDTYQPNWLQGFASALQMYDSGDDLRVGVSLGQQIFTPRDLKTSAPILNDRPYAGWLYLSFGLLTDTPNERIRKLNKLDLVVGVVGPQSHAEEVQRWVHDVTDSDTPEGWDNQLHNETTIDLQYQHEWILPLVGDSIDVVPRVALTLGTSQRYAGTGFTFRFGDGLSADAGPPLIRPNAAGTHYFQTSQSFYWYLFAGAHGRYVAHNIFLDGNTDGHSQSVDKKHWVAEAQGGLVMGWSNWRFTLTEIYRSREFQHQDEPDEFGALTVSYRF